MFITFDDINDILEHIQNKDPLGLNSDIEIDSYQVAKSKAPLKIPLEKMDKYDVILHYLKSADNINTSPDTDHTTKNTSPTLQVNSNILSTKTRPVNSISSGNLAKNTTSFKSFENINQSYKRSHMNSHDNMDEIPGSLEIIENNLTIWSKSNELIDIFNTKTKEVTEAVQGLHFITIDLGNKLSRGGITNNCPIIAQVTTGSNVSTQVRVEIYPLPNPFGVKYKVIYTKKWICI